MEFTVERKTWHRGKSFNHSVLRNSKGEQCCLGFVCQQLGYSDKDILEKTYPNRLELNKYSEGLVNDPISDFVYLYKDSFMNTELTTRAAGINDNPEIEDIEREKLLIKLFAKYNHKISFID